MSEEKHVALYYKQGSSDKEYHVHLTKSGGGFRVSIEYGRRGNSLTSSQKTPVSVDLDKATIIFDKLVREKTLKGYTEEAGKTPYVGGDKENKITGVLPQLLNNIDEEDVDDYLDDDAWCMQEKKDGKRILFRKSDGLIDTPILPTIEAINRKGLLVGFPDGIQTALATLLPSFIFDGELISETIWFFDSLELAGSNLRDQPYGHRYTLLQKAIHSLDVEGSAIRLVPSETSSKGKRKAFKALKLQGVEGVVFKRLDAIFKPGRPSSGGDQLKFKFHGDPCTCIVSGHHEKGKRSAYIQMLDGKTLVDVGKVTILPNFDVPKVGALVEIKYLYRHVHGALYQPVYLGERDDKDNPDQVSTLKVKEGIDDDDEG